MKKLYAAYGSNLNVAQMRFRCPDAVSITTGWLRGHELVFRGRPNGAVATIEPQEKSCVPVALWYISEGDEQALDIYEGYPHFYTKEQMTFSTPQGDVSAMVYVMTPGHCAGRPSSSYYNTIWEGYHNFGLDHAPLDKAVKRSEALMLQEPSCDPTLGW